MIILRTLSKRVPWGDLDRMRTAIQYQLRADFAPAWSRVPVKLWTGPKMAEREYPVITVVDRIDEPDALAYHTEIGGRVVGVVGVQAVLDAGGSLYGPGPASVSAALSHEILEASVDPFCGGWEDGLNGLSYAREICDPVQDVTYPIHVDGVDVWVSNFVLPRWFDTHASGGFCDFLGKTTAPFTRTDGGYFVARTLHGDATGQVFGQRPAYRGGLRGAKRVGSG